MDTIGRLTVAQRISFTFGTVSTLYGLQAILFPQAFASAFGHPGHRLDTPSSRASAAGIKDPFVIATGGRTLALGLSVIVLSLQDAVTGTQAAGVILGSCSVSGLSDSLGCFAARNQLAALQHLVGAIVLGGVGFWLNSF